MQRKCTYQPWSDRQKKPKAAGNKEMLDTSQPTTESQGEEVPSADGDPQCSQAKSSRNPPKMKAVKLNPVVADMVAGFSGSPAKRSGTKDKERREELAAAVIEKRRALVARLLKREMLGASNARVRRSESPSTSGGDSDHVRNVKAAMGRSGPGGAIHTSLEGNGASDDVMEISPTQVRKGGMFSGVGNDLPGGGMKKTKHRKHHRGEFKDSSEDEGSSDCEVIAHGKSKGHGRHRRANSESSEDDQSPQGYRRYGEKKQTPKYRKRHESSSDSDTEGSPRYRRRSREHRRKSRHGRRRQEKESFRNREESAHGKRRALQTSEEEYEMYGSRLNVRGGERQTMSPMQEAMLHAKSPSGEAGARHARMLPRGKSDTPPWRVEVKEEALSESALRRERKRRQVSREAEMERREKMGRKPHFLTVDDRGRPYGLGAKSWRAELNKMCSALDPSVMDVRNQPHKPMMTLKKRLASKFEYSADIDDDWLRGEIGRGVSTRRFQLMEMIRNGDQIPPGFDIDIWYNLQKISDDPKYKEKSEAMRHANSMRRTKGRTGPKGEMGIVEDLREHFGRSPDPDEIEDEMQRDKGYAGASSRKRKGLYAEESGPISKRSPHAPAQNASILTGDNGIGGMEHRVGARIDVECEFASPGRTLGSHGTRTPLIAALEQEAYVQALLKRLADLEARAGASTLLSTPAELDAGDDRQQMPPHSEGPERICEETKRIIVTGIRSWKL